MRQEFHRFRADTFEQALNQMRRELGEEAAVVRTAQVREGGVLGMLGRKMVELTASVIEPERSRPRAKTRKEAPKQRPLSSYEKRYQHARVGSDETVQDTVAYYKELVEAAQKRMARQKEGSKEAPAKPAQPEKPGRGQPMPARSPKTDREPVRAAKPRGGEDGNAALRTIPFPGPEERGKEHRVPAQDALMQRLGEIQETLSVLLVEQPGADVISDFGPHYRMLLDKGVTRRLAACLLAAALKDTDIDSMRDEKVLRERLKLEIQKQVPVTGGLQLTPGQCRVVALAGPTGVGKTTTLAKLAARYSVSKGAEVALISADNYRIAAPEQLKTYANILGAPFEVVNDANEMAAAIQKYRGYDLVLIDTAGGSQYNRKHVAELRRMLQAAKPDECFLVLSCTTRLEDARSVVDAFRMAGPTGLVFSKLDETRVYGTVLSITAEAGLPLSYFGVGQNVPDDLVAVQPGMVGDLVMEGKGNRG